MPDPTKSMLTFMEAGALLMISDHWVRDLSKKGYIPSPIKGRVPLDAAVSGYIKWLKAEDRRSSKTASASKLQELRAQEISLRIAEKTRELIPMDDAVGSIDLIFGTLKSELIGIPARVSRDLLWRKKIEIELDEALNRACDRIEGIRASYELGVDPFASNNGAIALPGSIRKKF